MTSRRRLKKEIDYVVSDLILDCFTYASLQEKPNDEEVLQIVQETLTLRNETLSRANHPEQKEASATVRSYYNKVVETLLEGIDKGYEKLGILANPKE
ncbi:MAG TPA: hypothetical protein VFC65_10005 [Prolixibacteraceae bacterium]|nr:hypothetical protein [Prolixibacteraceae bacterium]